MNLRAVSSFVLTAFVAVLLLPGIAPAADNADLPGSYLLAERKGPILWHFPDDIRKAMENDLEMLRLYNEAAKGQKRRKTIGIALFIPGAIIFAAGATAGIFQHAIGLYDDDYGDYLMVGGVTIGAGLIAPAVYFTGWPSPAEKRYDKYIREKYGVTPIIRLTPTPDGAYAQLGFQF